MATINDRKDLIQRIYLRLDSGSILGDVAKHLEDGNGIKMMTLETLNKIKKFSIREFSRMKQFELVSKYMEEIENEANLKKYMPISRPEVIMVYYTRICKYFEIPYVSTIRCIFVSRMIEFESSS